MGHGVSRSGQSTAGGNRWNLEAEPTRPFEMDVEAFDSIWRLDMSLFIVCNYVQEQLDRT